MAASMTRAEIGEKVFFSHIPDPKFKRNLVSINFIMPLDAATASDNAVVPYILRKGCREIPDFSDFNGKLAELYGASLSAGISKVNGWQVIGVSLSGLDNRFALEGEDITGECASLLAAVALDPKLDKNGVFDEKDTELERRFILDSIEAEINEKRSYALSKCMQAMCAGEPVAVRKYGTAETAGLITARSAAQAYRNMLKTASVEITFTGCGDPSTAKDIFTREFSKVKRKAPGFSLIPLRTTADSVKHEEEVMDVNQAKLVMGFRVGDVTTDEEQYAMRLCSAVLGGTPFSKFFLNVREKLSLCYYCAANYDRYNRLLVVDSGIEYANRKTTQGEIMRQIKAVQDGEVTDEELANTKLLAASSITKSTDSPSAMESWYLHQFFRHGSKGGEAKTPEEDAAALCEVTKTQLVEAARRIQLDTVYCLHGGEEGEGASDAN
ncbi:MAG: insulinase family protein [Oscillospiraceae bacterium]|nr:insulinase family protein [Oscillospiraceae bacterium]